MSTEKSRLKKEVKTQMKAKHKAKKKRMKRFKRGVALVVSTVALCTGAFGALVYFLANFKGQVKDKYQSKEKVDDTVVDTNYILVKSWFGEKDFRVTDEVYQQVEVGQTYTFKKNTGNPRVEVVAKVEEKPEITEE